MKLGEKIGKETLNEYIKKFGFGKTTGIDLPGEASGIVKKTENITESDLATISFGQTNTVNCHTIYDKHLMLLPMVEV